MEPLTMALMAGGGQLLSGFGSFLGSRTAANAASSAGQMGWLGSLLAGQAAEQGFQRAQGALKPFTQAGSKSLDLLMSYLQGDAAQRAGVGGGGPSLISTFAPTMEQLEKTPGYQWAREQALGSMTNAAAAKGMGTSGNLLQGLGTTATGLASQTFQQQLQNYLAQNQQAYNMLYGPSAMGTQAAQGIANAAMSAGGMIGNAAVGAGNALGQGIMGAGNALASGTQALFGAGGNALAMPMYSSMYGRNIFGQNQSPTNLSGAVRAQSPAFQEFMPGLNYSFEGAGNPIF